MMLAHKLPAVKESLLQRIFTFQVSSDTCFSPYRSRHKTNGKSQTLRKICHLHVALLALGVCLQLFKYRIIFELQKDNGTTGTLTENVLLQAIEGQNQELSAFSEAVAK